MPSPRKKLRPAKRRLADYTAAELKILEPKRESLTSRQFRELLDAKHVVGVAVALLAHKHPNPEELRFLWSRISLWLEDVS